MMRITVRTVAIVLVCFVSYACSGARTVAQEDISSAADRLRPALTEVEMDDYIESCLRENAVRAFTRQQGGHGFSGQNVTERDQQIMEECQEALFVEFPNPPPPKSEAGVMVLYRLYEKAVDCLQSLGLEVEQPSFDTYVDQGGTWFPYRDLPEPTSEQQWTEWNTECPQSPWEYE